MYKILKRFFDILASSTFLVLIAPWLFLIIALIIKVDSKGPVFYKQKRLGYKKKYFILYKFRTMVQGDHSIDNRGRYHEIAIDSNKITKAGRFLRRTGLDELPQFVNILLGNMSIIGPRPHPAVMDEEIGPKVNNYFKRLGVRPGLTGWAQVNGLRQGTPIEERVKYDLYYAENWSIWFDLKVILMSLFALKNAY